MAERLHSDFPILFSFQDQSVLAREALPDIYRKWCEIDLILANLRNDPKQHSNFHLDANVDLVLRLAEQEQFQIFEKHDEFLMGGAGFMQIAMSKFWLFSAYELLRATCDHSRCRSPKDGYCHEQDCLRCSILRLKQELNGYRVHLGKLETESRPHTGVMAEKSHASLVFGIKNGSVGWTTRDLKSGSIKTTTRLDLSNLIIDSLASTFGNTPT
ncbi:hypothetical protein [Pseudorhodobacter sp. E13]|uniref:hypothetical protein n=1 Tax=Pseudorhodobacter sp. E13 TaxID=2487931 RepID=UPI000F8D5788|nr:hypothetical protein [Pseudorhodobacter sp. E13]